MNRNKPQRQIHVGQMIREEIARQDRDMAALAQEIGCCRTNIYKICSRTSVDTDTLIRLSVALGHNFLGELAAEVDARISMRQATKSPEQ